MSFFFSAVICDLGDNDCLRTGFVVLGAVLAMADVCDCDSDLFSCVELCKPLEYFLELSALLVTTPVCRLSCDVSVVKQSDCGCVKRLPGSSVSASNSAKMLLYGFVGNCTSSFFAMVRVSVCGRLDISWLGRLQHVVRGFLVSVFGAVV